MSTKMTPQLRFPEFTDKWQVKKLGDIVEFKNGKPFEDYVSESGEYNLITIDSVDIKGTLKSKFKKVTKNDSSLNKDDIVTVLSDIAHGNLLGLTALIPEDKRYVLNQRMGRLRPKGNDRADFLSQAINLKQVFFRKRGQGTSQRHIYERDIAQLELILPTESEQEKIADFLTAVDERIAVGEKKLELLETYKRGVMQKIFSQQIRFKDENGNPYPDWEEKKLGEISVIKTGKKDANIAKSDGEYRFYTCSRDYLHTDVYSFEGEAILVAGNADVGLCHYYNGEFEAYQRTYVLQNFKTDGKYLYKYLSHFFRQYALALMQSSAMTYITLGTLENFTVPLPSEEEQQKIATFLTSLDDKITAEKSKLIAAKQFKKALLQRMFV